MDLDLLSAIAQQEGYGVPGTIATRNNNPGDIVYGSFAQQYGATQDPMSSFAVFPDAQTGWTAEGDLLSSSAYSQLSIAQAIAKWNGNGANTPAYVQNVATWTGLDPSTTVSAALAQAGTGGSSTSSAAPSAGQVLSGIASGVMGGIAGTGTAAGVASSVAAGDSGFSFPSFPFGRVATIIVGMILLAAGLYLFKPVQNVVNTTAQRGVKAGGMAAASAIAV